MAITLRSGSELQKIEKDEIKLTKKEEQMETCRENKLNITKLTYERVNQWYSKSSKLKREN